MRRQIWEFCHDRNLESGYAFTMEHLEKLNSYMPHGHCYLWEPGLVWTHVLSDLFIGFSYVAISCTLYLLIRRNKIPFSPIVLAFGVFIAACGLTHFMEVWNLWNAWYWLGADVKVLTAMASVATCVALIRLSPQISEFADTAKLSEDRGVKLVAAYAEMEERVSERTQELERSARLKDEFLATMSHELRTPLSVILGYAEMLNKGLSGAEQTKAIETIYRNAKTQSQLINDLLDVSLIMSGKMQLTPRSVDVTAVVRDALESVKLAAQAKGIEISLSVPSEDIIVLGEPIRLQQIVWNLLSNSIKFTGRGGKVEVLIHVADSRCIIEVTDNGEGIDSAFLPHVFERFRQEDASSSRKVNGLGLGLGIARHLTELHGGTIRAFSEGKGKGARFMLSLVMAPLAANEKNANPKTRSVTPTFNGAKILVVDDETDVRDMVVNFLITKGIKTESANSADDALIKIGSFAPDILICDIGMPVTDGYGLIRKVREQERKRAGFLPAIALTAYAHESVRQKVFSSGFQSYLTKPVESEILLAEIAMVLKNSSSKAVN